MEKLICENCGGEHDGSYGSGRFCCSRCKCIFVAKTTITERSKRLKQKYASGEIVSPQKGKAHTEEEKKKISESRKKYLQKHPDKVPYLLNHSSKVSYPEKYFKEVFEKEHIPLQYHKQVGYYQLDFYNESLMKYVEIDGGTHDLPKVQEIDKKRTEYLDSLGWTGFRIKWSDYQKLSSDDKNSVVQSIKEFLGVSNKYDYDRIMAECIAIQQEKFNKEHTCPLCGGYKDKKSEKCFKCEMESRKIMPIAKEELQRMIFEMPIVKLSEKLNVSHKLIEKWCRQFNIEKPEKGYWMKKQYENYIPHTNAEHGTMTRYKFGCRCEECKKACRDNTRKRRADMTKEQHEEINKKRHEKRRLNKNNIEL